MKILKRNLCKTFIYYLLLTSSFSCSDKLDNNEVRDEILNILGANSVKISKSSNQYLIEVTESQLPLDYKPISSSLAALSYFDFLYSKKSSIFFDSSIRVNIDEAFVEDYFFNELNTILQAKYRSDDAIESLINGDVNIDLFKTDFVCILNNEPILQLKINWNSIEKISLRAFHTDKSLVCNTKHNVIKFQYETNKPDHLFIVIFSLDDNKILGIIESSTANYHAPN